MTNMSDDQERRQLKSEVRRAIGEVLFNSSNYPAKMQSKVLGQDLGPLNEKLTLAVMKVLADRELVARFSPEAAEPTEIGKDTNRREVHFCGQVLFFGGVEVSRCILPVGHEGQRHRNIFTDWDV